MNPRPLTGLEKLTQRERGQGEGVEWGWSNPLSVKPLYLPRLANPALTPLGGFADSTATLRQKENVETLPATSPTKNPEAGIVPAQHLTKTAFPVSISRTVAIMRAPCGGMDIITKPYGVHHEQTHTASRFTAQREIPPAHRQGQKRQRRFQPPREAQKTPPGSRWCFFMSVIPALLGINDGSACPTRCRYWQPAHR